MTVVSDTSPLCYLTLIGHLDLLPTLFGQVCIPEEVNQELTHAAAPEAVRKMASAPPPWLEVRRVSLRDHPELRHLHAGEREAILLATELGADLIILDDSAARQAATGRGLLVTGTLGVLAEGAEGGLVDLAEPVTRLQQTNFRVSPELLRALLDQGNTP